MLRANRLGPAGAARGGFTLLEILVVTVILIILAGLATTAATLGVAYARTSATRALINQLQSALDERIERFFTDTQAGMPIDKYLIFAGGTVGDSASSTTGRRAALLARLDAMRSAFPQTFAEMVPAGGLMDAFDGPGFPTFETGMANTGTLFISQASPALTALQKPSADVLSPAGFASAPVVNPYETHQPIFLEYLLATQQIASKSDFQTNGGYTETATWSAAPHLTSTGTSRTYTLGNGQNASAHDPATESSECLYLILSDRTLGESIVDSIPSQFIRDTDGDGLLEFVDSWGRPIRFYRWATDTFAYLIQVSKQYPSVSTSLRDLAGDGSADDPIGDNTLDGDLLLYEFDVTANNLWGNASFATGTLGPVTNATLKDVAECMFGRLHHAYQTYDGANTGSTFGNVFMAGNAGNGRNESSYLGAEYQRRPRVYPFRALIVSAGADGQFGMYDANTEASTSDDGSTTTSIDYPQLHLGLRCGRVADDPDQRRYFADNVLSIELGEGVRQ